MALYACHAPGHTGYPGPGTGLTVGYGAYVFSRLIGRLAYGYEPEYPLLVLFTYWLTCAGEFSGL